MPSASACGARRQLVRHGSARRRMPHPARVETLERAGESQVWSVAGIARADAHLIRQAVAAPPMAARLTMRACARRLPISMPAAIEVYLYPFIMIGCARGNDLPDPHGGAEQARLSLARPHQPAIRRRGNPARGSECCGRRAGLHAFCNGTDGLPAYDPAIRGSRGGIRRREGFILGSNSVA